MQLTSGVARTRSIININIKRRVGRTFRWIGTLAFPVSFGVAIETNGDEIFDEETGVGEPLEIFLGSSGDLPFGGANRQ